MRARERPFPTHRMILAAKGNLESRDPKCLPISSQLANKATCTPAQFHVKPRSGSLTLQQFEDRVS